MKSFVERLEENGRRVGWFEGDEVYRFQGRYYAIQDGQAVRLTKNDVEFEADLVRSWQHEQYLVMDPEATEEGDTLSGSVDLVDVMEARLAIAKIA